MEFLVYRSTALVAPDSTDCRAIVESSIRRNTMTGLTGFLYLENGSFLQYLEGTQRPLWSCFDRIVTDERHESVVLLGHGTCRRRQFADWRMGFADAAVASFVDFLSESAVAEDVAHAKAPAALAFMRGVCQRVDLGMTAAG